jgi:CRP-like cAMP-binding protein
MAELARRSPPGVFGEHRQNALLARLPSSELQNLASNLTVLDVERRQRVYEPESRISHAYFPLTAVYSVVAVADDNASVEVATTGREGMVGLPLFLGADSSPQACFCQISGQAASIPASDFRRALNQNGAMHRVLNRFTQATMVQIAQNVVCNMTHSAAQRACRWLLTTQDRVQADQFPITHEFMAQMLGVRRATVSETLSGLQSRGVIRYTRGMLTITNREKTVRASCSCYGIIKAEFDELTRGV